MIECGRFSAGEHLAKAASHVKIAQDIMDKAHEPAQDILAKAQEPIFQLKSFPCDARMKDATGVEEVLDDTEVSRDTQVSCGSFHGAYVIASQSRPSKAP